MDGTTAPRADWAIGVDIGGTFMDFCALERGSGRMVSLKVLTTPDDPGAELGTGLALLAEREGLDATTVSRFVHGTTVGINTVLQRRGARMALVTNAGFEDVIELARLRMPDMYSLFCHRPDPLVSRDMIYGIPARMTAEGVETRAPDLGAVAEAVADARTKGAEGVIVALLHSWKDARHEAMVRAEIERLAPDLFVFASAEVWPVIREYERTSTALLNGYVHPRVAGYLEALEARLAGAGVPASALLTRSNGGLMTAGEGRRDCVSMLLSGTASGVIGAAWLARQAGEDRILTLDIGGTSADFALIIDGAVQFGTGELIGDFPLHIPSVSVSSIGIGGGSIATVDDHGVLRVGPQSAGSRPGPACYGLGGTAPTVTDALAVLGWLGHSQMAYGQLAMQRDLAVAAVGGLASALGRGVEETAQAIVEIAVSEMFVEVEKLASRAGVDLRDFALMPFGGGGPMLGAMLARELGLKRVIAPRRPGVVSALGGLVADLRGDFIRSVHRPLDAGTLADLRDYFEELSRDGRDWLARQGHDGALALILSAEMRYAGQSHEIDVVLSEEMLGSGPSIAAAFHSTHKALYDFDDPEGAIEVVSVKLSAIGAAPRPEVAPDLSPAQPADPAAQVTVWQDRPGLVDLYRREALSGAATFQGPAIVAQDDTTLIIPAGFTARVDPFLNLHLVPAE